MIHSICCIPVRRPVQVAIAEDGGVLYRSPKITIKPLGTRVEVVLYTFLVVLQFCDSVLYYIKGQGFVTSQQKKAVSTKLTSLIVLRQFSVPSRVFTRS